MYYISYTVGPIFDRQVKTHYKEKCSLDGAANRRRSCAQNDFFLVPHEEALGSKPGRGNRFDYFKVYVLIAYYSKYIVYIIYYILYIIYLL